MTTTARERSCYRALPVLLRVALHQTRFRTPGVAPDARGVLLGPKGLLVFASLDRVVGFLRAASEDGVLDELAAELELRFVETPLRTREVMLVFTAESSYRMDRIASLARLTGGGLFTGAARHFVRYRDASAPLGYDVREVLDAAADRILYDATYQQTYTHGRTIALRDLLLRLAPVPSPEPSGTRGPVWVLAEVGIGHAIVSYLYRSGVDARAALAEWPPESAFDERPRRLYLLEIEEPPDRVVQLFRGLPGVSVFRPASRGAAVEIGYRHPVALDGCPSVFPEGSLHLFRGKGEVAVLDPLPRSVPVASLVRIPYASPETAGDAPRAAEAQATPFALSLRLAPATGPFRNVVAAVVPASARAHLARMLYALPARALEGLSIALTETHAFLVDPRGIEGIPLGRFFSEAAPRVYVPAGMTLVPPVAPEVLSRVVHGEEEGHVFFLPGDDRPVVIANEAFAPMSTRVLSDVSARPVHAEAPESHDAPLPTFAYDAPRRFPLRGLPEAKPEAED